MCLLALFYRMVEDAAVVVAANREEAYARGGDPPELRDVPGHHVAGHDPLRGGTWLGVNAAGVLVAVTNRRSPAPTPDARSRGLLVLDLLQCPTAAEATDQAIRELEAHPYAGCNVLCVDARSATVVQAGDWMRVRPLPPGVHVLAHGDVNDEYDERVAYARDYLYHRRYARASDCLAAAGRLCSQAGGEDGPPICLHGAAGGTVSSSLVALREPLSATTWRHAQGPPDRTPYEDCSHLLAELARG